MCPILTSPKFLTARIKISDQDTFGHDSFGAKDKWLVVASSRNRLDPTVYNGETENVPKPLTSNLQYLWKLQRAVCTSFPTCLMTRTSLILAGKTFWLFKHLIWVKFCALSESTTKLKPFLLVQRFYLFDSKPHFSLSAVQIILTALVANKLLKYLEFLISFHYMKVIAARRHCCRFRVRDFFQSFILFTF